MDQQPEDIAVLLELVADTPVADVGGVPAPAGRMAAGPIAVRRGADIQRHPQPVADIETRAAHLGQFPTSSEIAGPPFWVRLEPAAGKNDRVGGEFDELAALLCPDPGNPFAVID